MRPDPYAPLPILDECQQRYTDRWNASSEDLAAHGHYVWMEHFIRDQPRVLEIGTGTGQSTAVLLKTGHSVISVDENPRCLAAAESYLRGRGFKVDCAPPRAHRALMLDAPTDLPEPYAVLYEPLGSNPDPEHASVLLVEGNVLIDPELKSWLCGLPPRDAVICWLIGVHQGVHAHAQLGFRRTEQDYYRVRVQNAVYELADAVIVSGGVLHIVDRAEYETEEHRRIMMESHAEMTTLGASLRVESLAMRPYHIPAAEGHVPVQNQQGEVAAGKDIFLVSIIVRKT